MQLTIFAQFSSLIFMFSFAVALQFFVKIFQSAIFANLYEVTAEARFQRICFVSFKIRLELR